LRTTNFCLYVEKSLGRKRNLFRGKSLVKRTQKESQSSITWEGKKKGANPLWKERVWKKIRPDSPRVEEVLGSPTDCSPIT